MGAVCPSRKPAAAATITKEAKPATQEAFSKDVVNVQSQGRVKEGSPDKLAPTLSHPLPAKSWRALLTEADNTSGKVFTEPVLKPLKKPGDAFTNNDEKQIHGRVRDPVTKAFARPKTANRRVPDALPPVSTKPASGMTVQTATYLTLLKEGGMKKKTPIGPPAAPAKGVDTSKRLLGPTPVTQLASSLPTTTYHGQTWKNLLKASSINSDKNQDAPTRCWSSQDDILFEKFAADLDLADPVYWSDTESVATTPGNASAHRLGHGVPRKAVRTYVMQDLSLDIDRSVGMLLARLSRYCEQERAICPESGHQNRRFVFGLKEVIRRIKQVSVACVVVAPDLQSNPAEGGLDDRVREIIAAAHEKKIPVIFALSRSRLGQAMGRSMMMSVIGILDVTGAQNLFNTTVELAREGCQSWLSRLPTK